jgi:hypothetical protein
LQLLAYTPRALMIILGETIVLLGWN